jgi:quinoprotein glucose dehydrogenase
MSRDDLNRTGGTGRAARAVMAVLLAVCGLGAAIPGARLAQLGGSWFYLLAGVAMVATAVLLWLRRREALWLYALLVIATLAWAVSEIGLDWWGLVPRGDVIFVLGLLLLLPWITRGLGSRWIATGGVLALALLIAAAVGVASMLRDPYEQAGALPGVRAAPPQEAAADDWPAYGRTWRGLKWSPLSQLTPANVGRLQVTWTFHTGDFKRPGDPVETTNEDTPLKVGDTVFLCTPHDWIYALDAETGRMRWKYDPHIRVRGSQHMSCRGVSYHDADQPGAARAANGECPQRLFVATNDARLIAIDVRTGQPCRGFGEGGQVNLWAGMPQMQEGWYQGTSAPLVTRGLVVVAGAVYDNASVKVPSGVIRAFDAATGRLVWNFDPGNPDSTAPIGPGQRYSWSSPNSWSTSAADEDLGLIYVPMGMGAIDEYGAGRPATTETYATTVLALDIATGKPRWVYQTVHHDLWDMDVPAQPALVDLNVPGRGGVPALVQATKTGNLFVLDRRTGVPIFPAPETPVPGGPAPGDSLSPTQPFSTVTFRPLARVREADMWGISLYDQLACRIAFRGMRYDGPFTPPSVKGSLVYPGNFGVFDWGGVSVDPARQVVFANPDYMAFVDKLIPRQSAGQHTGSRGPASPSDRGGSQEAGYNPNRGAPFAVDLNPFLSILKLPCQAPPWGFVAGLDLATGKVVYKHRNGTVQDESPVPLPLKMGVPAMGGPITTAGGLAFLTGTLDYYIRAYDETTGRELWKARLPAGAQATPMTYRSGVSGRQFVVTVAAGHGSLGTKTGDSVIAYALPKGG